MISRTVTDFIGHTEQVLENNIFWSKIDSGFREPTQHPPIGYQKQASKYFFLFRNNNIQPSQCLGWTNQKNCWEYIMSILKYIGHVCHCPNTT